MQTPFCRYYYHSGIHGREIDNFPENVGISPIHVMIVLNRRQQFMN